MKNIYKITQIELKKSTPLVKLVWICADLSMHPSKVRLIKPEGSEKNDIFILTDDTHTCIENISMYHEILTFEGELNKEKIKEIFKLDVESFKQGKEENILTIGNNVYKFLKVN